MARPPPDDLERELAAEAAERAGLTNVLELVDDDEGEPVSSGAAIDRPFEFLFGADLFRGAKLPLYVGPTPQGPRDFPGTSGERMRWEEPFGARTITPTNQTPLLWELARIEVGVGDVFVLERLGTYLRATPVDGSPVVTDGSPIDPFTVITDGAGVLSFAWHQVVTTGKGKNGEPEPALTAVSVAAADGGIVDGFPRRWADLRYAWGTRYTEHHQAIVQGPARIRYFVELAAPVGASWTVVAGIFASGYHQAAGMEGAALRSSLVRSGS